LLSIAVQPIFSVMQTSLSRSQLGRGFHDRINDDHRAIAAAIAAGDEDTAADAMHKHLAYLRPFDETSWRRRDGRVDTRAN
jgi:DNA-binding FadR family transcriptional regulator